MNVICFLLNHSPVIKSEHRKDKKKFFTATKYERITVRSLNYQRDKRYLSEKYRTPVIKRSINDSVNLYHCSEPFEKTPV